MSQQKLSGVLLIEHVTSTKWQKQDLNPGSSQLCSESMPSIVLSPKSDNLLFYLHQVGCCTRYAFSLFSENQLTSKLYIICF